MAPATDMERLEGYDLVVIEPSEFQAEQIEAMHAAGQTVYGYLNIGAIEKGMKTLRQSGINAALAGFTSLEEVLTSTL